MSNVNVNPEASAETAFRAQNVARIKVLKHGISIHEKFEKLQASKLYKELIGELYLTNEAQNLVELIADPSANNVDSQRSIQMRLGGISAFKSFIAQYARAGQTAQAEMHQLEQINAALDAGATVEDVLAQLDEAQARAQG